MDLLKKQFDRIQQQLAGLNASQKMLTMSLLAIMVMTFLWWGKYAVARARWNRSSISRSTPMRWPA